MLGTFKKPVAVDRLAAELISHTIRLEMLPFIGLLHRLDRRKLLLELHSPCLFLQELGRRHCLRLASPQLVD